MKKELLQYSYHQNSAVFIIKQNNRFRQLTLVIPRFLVTDIIIIYNNKQREYLVHISSPQLWGYNSIEGKYCLTNWGPTLAKCDENGK